MQRDLEAMASRVFDVLVIGGGINGAGVAKDASLRGLSVGLVDKAVFGAGTTARSTRLVHGGLRYLELFDFGLVREGLLEREILLRQAPHLVRPLPFITPIYTEDRVGPVKLKAGMILYDLLSWGKSLPRHRVLGRDELSSLEPGLRQAGLRTAVLYYDAQVAYPERLCLENLLSAAAAGAQLANHTEVEGFERGRVIITAVRVRDKLSGRRYTLRARLFVNAGGPWCDDVLGYAGRAEAPRVRTTKGVHLAVPAFTRHAVVLIAARDGRVFFTIPWQGMSLVGTTDTDYGGDKDRVGTTDADVRYLIDETRRLFPEAPLERIFFTTSGLRPLVREQGKAESAVSRRHLVVDHAAEGLDNLISVIGGKITNHRRVAAEAVDLAVRRLHRGSLRSTTAQTPFFGGGMQSIEALQQEAIRAAPWLPPDTVVHLVETYGTRWEPVARLAQTEPELAAPVVPGRPEILAQLVHAVRSEMARTVGDVLLRRVPSLGLRSGLGEDAAAAVADVMARELDWSSEDVRRALDAYADEVALMRWDPPEDRAARAPAQDRSGRRGDRGA
ncbi:MAG TPA: glycerol-3-phosphate dehydrogenase/oxidase [Limnochordia bacterium]